MILSVILLVPVVRFGLKKIPIVHPQTKSSRQEDVFNHWCFKMLMLVLQLQRCFTVVSFKSLSRWWRWCVVARVVKQNATCWRHHVTSQWKHIAFFFFLSIGQILWNIDFFIFPEKLVQHLRCSRWLLARPLSHILALSKCYATPR